MSSTEKAEMTSINASASGQFTIGDITINRLGYGAMRITGRGVWGPPSDRNAALATLRRLPEIGVNFIDTADSYGPDVSEELIREALHPYDGLLIATKAGLTRSGPDQWTPNGHPAYLIAQTRRSLRKLGVEQIDLWQLHRIDPGVPHEEQFGAVRQMLDDGIIRNAGLSEVSVADIEAARRVFPVVTVQNRYNLVDRDSEDVLAYCTANRIGFIPWFPLAAGKLTRPGGVVDRIAKAHAATPGQVALAWLLEHSPVILPIPGTLQVAHLEENVAAAALSLSPEEIDELDAAS
jgi:aryl-alcohol dehydrogenase-like predicted oxidoreductase